MTPVNRDRDEGLHHGDVMKSTKCPVCDWEIKDGGIKVKVAGKEITVCCDDCAKPVQADPGNYAAAH